MPQTLICIYIGLHVIYWSALFQASFYLPYPGLHCHARYLKFSGQTIIAEQTRRMMGLAQRTLLLPSASKEGEMRILLTEEKRRTDEKIFHNYHYLSLSSSLVHSWEFPTLDMIEDETLCRIGYTWPGKKGCKCCAHLPDRKKQRKSFTEGQDQCPILFW